MLFLGKLSIDDFNREALLIAIDTSINSKRVIRELEKLID